MTFYQSYEYKIRRKAGVQGAAAPGGVLGRSPKLKSRSRAAQALVGSSMKCLLGPGREVLVGFRAKP